MPLMINTHVQTTLNGVVPPVCLVIEVTIIKSTFPVIIYLSDKEICLIVCNEKSIIAKLRGRKDRPSVSFKRKRPFTSLTSLPADKAIVFTMSLFRTR